MSTSITLISKRIAELLKAWTNQAFRVAEGLSMRVTASLLVVLFWPLQALSQANVLTYHYDNARTGQNTQERFLSPATVRPNQFRKLFTQPVDGDVYAQPLYVAHLSVPGKGTHNVVFVATEGDSVYAFDADSSDGPNAAPLWKASLIDLAHGAAPGAATVCATSATGSVQCQGSVGCDDIKPQYGITSTPAIDWSTGTLYVVGLSQENGISLYRLHALDITTGNEKVPPVVISGAVNGVAFTTAFQHNRPGLLLSHGSVYIAFGSHCDNSSFRGWVFSYDAATLTRKSVFLTTPNGAEAGIWMVGAAPAGDTNGAIYVSTGNGTFTPSAASNGFQDFGDSIIKLDPNLSRTPLDYFAPFNQKCMSYIPDSNNCPTGWGDTDLGSGGVLLLPDQSGPHPHLLVEAGKAGTIYLIDRDQMTAGNQHFCAACFPNGPDNNIVQELTTAVGAMGMPAYWNSNLYFRGSVFPQPPGAPLLWDGVLKSFSLTNGQLSTAAIASSTDSPYASNMTLSANGNDSGVVWALDENSPAWIAAQGPIPIVLNAYDAMNLSLIYSSSWNNGSWTPPLTVKFTSPVVANGKVYVGASGQLVVFSLFGIGGYDLGSPEDQIVPFDYSASGKNDHLALYRPGSGAFWILRNNAGTFTPVYQGNGIGGYDLMSAADRVTPFDYDSSGKLDHLLLYRPGTGTIWILKNDAGTFTPVYQGSGIGGYDLKSASDQIVPFDYDSSGKLDHLLLYRPGTGTIWILRNDAGTFTPVLQGHGIGGYDLMSAADRIIPFDYDASGKRDHLVLYRPGSGTIWILRNDAGSFTPIYQGGGIGGYDLMSTADQAASFDFDGTGKRDHLVLYRPASDTIWILRNDAGTFVPVYQGGGIGDYDLLSNVDRVLAFDYDDDGKSDHLVLYRHGSNKISILSNSAGIFAQTYAAW